MNYLVDTDVAANGLKGRVEQSALLQQVSSQGLAINLITYGEIHDGIFYCRDSQTHERIFQHFLGWLVS